MALHVIIANLKQLVMM